MPSAMKQGQVNTTSEQKADISRNGVIISSCDDTCAATREPASSLRTLQDQVGVMLTVHLMPDY
jgi:hypothetical protein